MEIRVQEKNIKKFKEVLLYILEKVGAKPNVGESVINKLLYFIDFDYYERFEENLTGATYIKNHFITQQDGMKYSMYDNVHEMIGFEQICPLRIHI